MITSHKTTHPIFGWRDTSRALVKKNSKNRNPMIPAAYNRHTDYSDTQLSPVSPSIDNYQQSRIFHRFQQISSTRSLYNHSSVTHSFEATPLFSRTRPFLFGPTWSPQRPWYKSPVTFDKNERGAWRRITPGIWCLSEPRFFAERSWRKELAISLCRWIVWSRVSAVDAVRVESSSRWRTRVFAGFDGKPM